MVTIPILVFPYWKEFHIYVDASSIALGTILAHPGEGHLNHPVTFSSIKLSTIEHNYMTMEHERLTIVYAL